MLWLVHFLSFYHQGNILNAVKLENATVWWVRLEVFGLLCLQNTITYHNLLTYWNKRLFDQRDDRKKENKYYCHSWKNKETRKKILLQITILIHWCTSAKNYNFKSHIPRVLKLKWLLLSLKRFAGVSCFSGRLWRAAIHWYRITVERRKETHRKTSAVQWYMETITRELTRRWRPFFKEFKHSSLTYERFCVIWRQRKKTKLVKI